MSHRDPRGGDISTSVYCHFPSVPTDPPGLDCEGNLTRVRSLSSPLGLSSSTLRSSCLPFTCCSCSILTHVIRKFLTFLSLHYLTVHRDSSGPLPDPRLVGSVLPSFTLPGPHPENLTRSLPVRRSHGQCVTWSLHQHLNVSQNVRYPFPNLT